MLMSLALGCQMALTSYKYGPIKQVHVNARQGPTGRDAIITFSSPKNAITAMTDLNATMLKNQKVKIRMANTRAHKMLMFRTIWINHHPIRRNPLRSFNLHKSCLRRFKTSMNYQSRKVLKENVNLLRNTRQNQTLWILILKMIWLRNPQHILPLCSSQLPSHDKMFWVLIL